MSFSIDELFQSPIKEKNIKTADDAQGVIKDLFGSLIQHMLEAELEDHLGYSKYVDRRYLIRQ